MEILDLLWELQKHENNLKYLKAKLKNLYDNYDIKAIKNKINQKEDRLAHIETRLKETEKKLIKNNLKLKDLDYRFKDIDRELYGGKVVDLRQLSCLDKEREAIKKEIDEKEIEILSQMEEVENLKADILEIQEDFKSLKIDYAKLAKEYKQLVKEIEKGIEEDLKEINSIYSKIDKDILKEYLELKKTKSYALAKVEDKKCSGCNMLLPTIMMDRLKNHKEIIYCENCQRILYFAR